MRATDERGQLLVKEESVQGRSERDAGESRFDLRRAPLLLSSCALLVAQNHGLFMVTRYTRTQPGEKYLNSVAVWFAELLKMLACLIMVCVQSRHDLRRAPGTLIELFTTDRRDTLKLGIPAVCYAVQNNLLFVALSIVNAAVAQVLYQTKMLFTAVFAVLLLRKRFSLTQWAALCMLTAGVVLVQSEDAKSGGASPSSTAGVAMVLAASILSGFAGVYLELMYVSGDASLWIRNIQLGLYSLPLQTAYIYLADGEAVAARGLMQGFGALTWVVVAIQFAGGLIVAVVVKHAGNILKNFANVCSVLLTCIVSIFVFDFQPTPTFWAGVLMCTTSFLLYADALRPLALRCAPLASSAGWRRGAAILALAALLLGTLLALAPPSFSPATAAAATATSDHVVGRGIRIPLSPHLPRGAHPPAFPWQHRAHAHAHEHAANRSAS